MNALRHTLLLATLLPMAAVASTPENVPLTRYQPLIQRSPFSPATAPAPAPATSFTKDYYITGLATLGDKAFVSISSRDNQTRFSLLEGESFEGITFTRVDWVPGVGKSQAVLTKDGTTGVVSFDEVAMRAAPPTAAATPAHNPAAQQGQQGGWGRGRGDQRRGRDRRDWGSREQRQMMREQRREWFRAMHGGHGGGGQGGQMPNQHQRQQPINSPR